MWKVLVVDDNTANRELLVALLEDKAKCNEVENGEDALTAYDKSIESSEPYDFILLDVAMPGVDGVDVLQRIRDKEEAGGVLQEQRVSIIMVTAHKEVFMDAFNRGCDDYLLKPIDGDQLISKMQEKLPLV